MVTNSNAGQVKNPNGFLFAKAVRGFWFISLVPVLMVIPLSLVHDLRVTFAAMAIMLAVTAVIARIRGLSLIVQIALWAGALGSAASIFIIGAHLHG
jgi:lysylphosphatidylglycerol synthetase-like protein (DUF2156 family)